MWAAHNFTGSWADVPGPRDRSCRTGQPRQTSRRPRAAAPTAGATAQKVIQSETATASQRHVPSEIRGTPGNACGGTMRACRAMTTSSCSR